MRERRGRHPEDRRERPARKGAVDHERTSDTAPIHVGVLLQVIRDALALSDRELLRAAIIVKQGEPVVPPA